MIGSTILHYKILEKLGEGGMGVVYLAEDTKLKREVAIKFLPHHISANEEERKRFEIEAQAAASLNHPNIATVYSIENSGDEIFIVMEYIDGVELKDKIKSTPIPINEAINIAIQIVEGLAAAHEKGIVHRDIKSDNIMLTPKGQVKIMDFGLAKVKGASKLTQAGSTVGTAAYMSPEQAQGEEVDTRSDIFSFGIILYEMLTTHLPFRGEHQAALLYSVINEEPQPIARFNEKVTEDLERIVLKSLAKDRDERYQHIDDMLADLRRERKNLEYVRSGYVKKTATIPAVSESNKEIQPVQKKSEKKGYTFKIIIPAAIVILLAAAFFIFNPFKSQEIQNNGITAAGNSLAVMYFENIPDPLDKEHTSEMLTNLLITSLSQVKGLEVISRERLLNIQKDLGQTDTKTISSSIAEQVAERAGVTTMLVGSILQEKPKLAVTTRLIDVQSGKIISSQQVTNFSADKIFNLVDSLSILIQSNFQTPSSQSEVKSVAEITTESREAYRAYVTGLELRDKLYNTEAIAAFSRAIEIDKNFAMAYYSLSLAQSFNSGINQESQASLKKAVELADRTTEHERLQILTYNYAVQNNMLEAIKGYEELINKYPHEISSYLQLGYNIYDKVMLEPAKGLEVLQSGLKIEPSAKILQNLIAYTFAWLGRKQEALNAVNRYINLAPAEPNPYDTRGDILAWFGEYDSSFVSYKKAENLRSDFFSANKIGIYYLLRGKYSTARKYFQILNYRIPLIEVHRGQIKSAMKEIILLPESEASEEYKLRRLINLCYESGQYNEMLSYSKQYSNRLRRNPTDIIYGRDYLAWALVKNGKTSEAENIINELEKNVNEQATIVQANADYTSALVYFEEGKFNQALEFFRKLIQSLPPNHEPNIFYGISLLKTGEISEAILEFNHLLYWPGNNDIYILRDFPGNELFWPVPQVIAHYWLGVAYEQQGNKEKAINEYKIFLDIWKDADFNSPEMKDAKVRVAKLEGK